MKCTLKITVPGDNPTVSPGRHIAVWGTISSDAAIPCDCVLTSSLIDSGGNVLRHTVSTRKNSDSMVLYRDDLTCYPERMDAGHRKMREFGFPELMTDSGGSLTNATVKSWYSDTEFKTFFVSATDAAHGLIFDDGVGMTDEYGQPYTTFPVGEYTVSVTLSDAAGNQIASDEKKVIVAHSNKTVICRFNPKEHKKRMLEWAKRSGFTVVSDIIPGYLDSYLGIWMYHMGLLTMYRANDIALYTSGKTHVFVYLISSDSTSYETELAYLQECGAVADETRFAAYCYDIGEAELCTCGEDRLYGNITEFGKDEYMHIYRVDTVNEFARENYFDLSGCSVVSTETDKTHISVKSGSRIAITGALRPYQMAECDFIKRDDNTYEIKNRPDMIVYTFKSGEDSRVFERRANMTRFDKKDIGDSVFEFYNLFDIDSSMRGKRYSVHVEAYDLKGRLTPACADIILNVT